MIMLKLVAVDLKSKLLVILNKNSMFDWRQKRDERVYL